VYVKRKNAFESRRRSTWLSICRRRKVDVFLFTKPQDIGYLAGFTGTENGGAYLLLSERWSMLIPGNFYREQAAEECAGLEIYSGDDVSYAAVMEILKGRNIGKIGIQPEAVTLSEKALMRKAFSRKKLVEIDRVTRSSRISKDTGEIASVRKAVAIARRAFEELVARGASGLEGRSEKDIAMEMEYRLREHGADKSSFDTIVASGPNTSRCHHFPTERKVCLGEPLLID